MVSVYSFNGTYGTYNGILYACEAKSNQNKY